MFEIFKSDKNQEFYFRFKDDTDAVILRSEGYKAKNSCVNGVESVKNNATNASRIDKQTAGSGKLFFNIKSSNGQTVATSKMYDSEQDMTNDIEAIVKHVPNAQVSDLTA